MKEIIKLLKNDPQKAIHQLTVNSKNTNEIEKLQKEYKEIDRDERSTQIGQMQKDKMVGKGDKRRLVKGVRIPIPFQNKIVTTATAFEVGEPITILPTEKNKFSEEIERLWKANRTDSVLQKAKTLQKSELQCAILFYIKDLEGDKNLGKPVGLNNTKEIKLKILENKNGKMSPYFDSFGDMKAFVWEFTTKNTEDKEVKHAWVYDENNVYKISNKTSKMVLESNQEHGFGKIPVVYCSQEKEEWFTVQKMIDRLEVTLSKLGAANDYSGQPILKLFGEVISAGDKDEDGKAMRFPMKVTDEEKVVSGDAKFLERENAPESVKLEIDRLEKYIYSMTSTPDISFDNMTGIGAISGVAIKLMFLDAMVKAKLNEGENRTIIDRILNIFIAGNIKTVNTGLKTEATKTYFDIQFNSILPDDLKETVETLAAAVQGRIMSIETAVESLDMTSDLNEELTKIKSEDVPATKTVE